MPVFMIGAIPQIYFYALQRKNKHNEGEWVARERKRKGNGERKERHEESKREKGKLKQMIMGKKQKRK